MTEKPKKPGEAKKSLRQIWNNYLTDPEEMRINSLQDDPKWMEEWLKNNGGGKPADKPDSKP